MKIADPAKYKKMIMTVHSRALLKTDPAKFASFCNGVGSKVGFWAYLTYHFTPNTIGFVNITAASDGHDVDFSIPCYFNTEKEAREHFHMVNDIFIANLHNILDSHEDWLTPYRNKVIEFYDYCINSEKGWKSFLKGKEIG